jgi:DNA repair exonuclease SbcCD ATPase subunit
MSLYRYVGVIAPGMSFPRRTALVAAARSLDTVTSVDGSIREIESELQSLSKAVPSRANLRQRVAETAADIETKRERVATIRGRLQETDDGSIEAEYRTAIRALSEAETQHAAAVEALEAARDRARTARNVRDRRLRLEDRLENLKRTAREELISAVSPAIDAALSSLPHRDPASLAEADPISAALALARVGRLETPITLACRRFPDRDSAERWLEAPVYRI